MYKNNTLVKSSPTTRQNGHINISVCACVRHTRLCGCNSIETVIQILFKFCWIISYCTTILIWNHCFYFRYYLESMAGPRLPIYSHSTELVLESITLMTTPAWVQQSILSRNTIETWMLQPYVVKFVMTID